MTIRTDIIEQDLCYMVRKDRMSDVNSIKFGDVAKGSYVYMINTSTTKPLVIRGEVLDVEPASNKEFVHLKILIKDSQSVVFTVPLDGCVSTDEAELVDGIIFSSKEVLFSYSDNLSRETRLYKEGWLPISKNNPAEFERIKCSPIELIYTEDAYYVRGEYIKEGYRKVLNDIMFYWKPL